MLGAIHTLRGRPNAGQLGMDILDDSVQPSAYFLAQSDPRIRYHRVGARQCVGDKRNWLSGQARDAIIAHVEDEEHYAPQYLE